MPLSNSDVLDVFKELKDARDADLVRLNRIRSYLRDDPDRRLTGLPSGTPRDVTRLAMLSRVNVLKFIVNSRVQAMYVDGYRAPRAASDQDAWLAWQANGFDARQIGVHRTTLAYGTGYVTVLPGGDMPVLRGVSPRQMTALYGEDDMWPVYALEKRRARSGLVWRVYDNEAVYTISEPKDGSPEVSKVELHKAKDMGGRPVCPVVRYRETSDLDDMSVGIVEPFIPLQDQINITTFGLQVAQHYGAFRQRYILGWLAESEEQKLKAGASKLWTFEEQPDEIEVGEFEQTNLDGYIKSREASLKHLATVSQTPAHELIGEMVNISADALVAAEASKRRAITENQTVIGESHEQVFGLVSRYQGAQVDPLAYVRWKDTEARALGQLVDALGKSVQMLGIPPQALWERIADAMGVSDQELQSWKDLAAQDDSFARLEQTLERQASGAVV